MADDGDAQIPFDEAPVLIDFAANEPVVLIDAMGRVLVDDRRLARWTEQTGDIPPPTDAKPRLPFRE
ncbi:MAG: hypothetical protein ACRD1K_09815 [Acidimicrobiales bacterium]